MKRSTTAILPSFPTAPNRSRMPLRLHQASKPWHQNWEPLSQMTYLGLTLAYRRPRKVRTWMDAGYFLKTAAPMARREKWSMTTAAHQRNGQTCGKANGVHAVHMPSDVGTTAKST